MKITYITSVTTLRHKVQSANNSYSMQKRIIFKKDCLQNSLRWGAEVYIEQTFNTPLTEGPVSNLVKIVQVVSEKTSKDDTVLYTYISSPGARVDNPRDILFYNKSFTALIIHSYFRH